MFVATADEEGALTERLGLTDVFRMWMRMRTRKLRAMVGLGMSYHQHHHLLHQWATMWHLFRSGGGRDWYQSHSFRADLDAMKVMVEEGSVTPVVGRVFLGLDAAVDAMEYSRYSGLDGEGARVAEEEGEGEEEAIDRRDFGSRGKAVLQIVGSATPPTPTNLGTGVTAGSRDGEPRKGAAKRDTGEKQQGEERVVAPEGSAQKMQFPPHTLVGDWLASYRLRHHIGHFHDLGIEIVEDLQDLDMGMIKHMTGLKHAEEKRLLRALKGYVDLDRSEL
jgi:hypothetical protein